MSIRSEFEKRFPVPKGVCWDEKCQSCALRLRQQAEAAEGGR